MRICIPVPCFFGKMDFCEAIAKIAQLGFDAAETYNWKSLDLDAVRNACEQSGVELLSMCTTEFNMTNPAKRKALSKFLSKSCTFGCDKQGRIMLGETILSHVGINKDVCLVGMGATFEIWDPKAREKWLGESSEQDEIALLEELGL